ASYRYVSGSSVAAAHVTGVVALLLAARSDLTSVDVGRLLMAAVDQRGGVPMLDACKALGTIRGSHAFCSR
ncbi:MAG: S8 family serine peptidase, partial [Pseudomonadota bacterium]